MTTRTKAKRYVIALLAIASTLLLRLSVEPLVHGHPTLVLPFSGVLVAAWYGGLNPGLLAVVVSTASVIVVMPEGSSRLHASEPQTAVFIAVYTLVATVSAVLIARLRTVTDHLKATNQRVERTSELLLAAQRASQSGVWVWEPQTNYVYWSGEHFHLYGLQKTDSMSVEHWIQAIHRDDRQAVARVFEACTRTPMRLDSEFRLHSEIATVWCRLVGDVVAYDPVRLAGITIDITHQKNTELDLKRSNEDLDSFAHVVSHDLKEPIRMVTAYAQLIQRRYGASLGHEGAQFLEHVLSGAGRMQQLVEALLALSSANSREVQQNISVDLNKVVQSAVASLQRIASTTHANITWNNLPAVAGNDVVLVQIFQNLIQNALKYRRQDQTPCIHIEARPHNRYWKIDVKDNGIGFDMEYATKVFMPFRRLHAPHQYEGTGIGLATCKRSIERLGGRIEAQSEPGKGSVFTLILPAFENESVEKRPKLGGR